MTEYPQTPDGRFFWGDHVPGHPRVPERRPQVESTMFESLGRIVVDGGVVAGPHELIPLERAVAYGAANEDGTPVKGFAYDDFPVIETKSVETKADLAARATVLGIEVPPKATKAQIAELIGQHEAAE